MQKSLASRCVNVGLGRTVWATCVSVMYNWQERLASVMMEKAVSEEFAQESANASRQQADAVARDAEQRFCLAALQAGMSL